MTVGASLDETHGLFRFACFLGVMNDCLLKGEEESGGNDSAKSEDSSTFFMLFLLLLFLFIILFGIFFDTAAVDTLVGDK